tara:strand:+ start:22 stop:492 length:471 start_codon:yes stop_codon:yes gene_type:complete
MTLQKQKKKIRDAIRLIAFLLLANSSNADELLFKFKSPSFSGINSSSHYLTIENQENTRKNAIQEKIESDADDIERAQQNTTLARFIRNFESRVYAQLSRQLVDQLFGENPSTQGTLELEGNLIEYIAEADKITLTITDENGDTTTITVPTASFTF